MIINVHRIDETDWGSVIRNVTAVFVPGMFKCCVAVM
jgi:hypothetical protein